MSAANNESIWISNQGMRRVLIGAGIAFFLIALFLSGVDEPKPEWSKFWMVRPLIIVPLAGATGGLVYHLIAQRGREHGWNSLVYSLISLVIYIIGLWMGFVLGLDGTLWN